MPNVVARLVDSFELCGVPYPFDLLEQIHDVKLLSLTDSQRNYSDHIQKRSDAVAAKYGLSFSDRAPCHRHALFDRRPRDPLLNDWSFLEIRGCSDLNDISGISPSVEKKKLLARGGGSTAAAILYRDLRQQQLLWLVRHINVLQDLVITIDENPGGSDGNRPCYTITISDNTGLLWYETTIVEGLPDNYCCTNFLTQLGMERVLQVLYSDLLPFWQRNMTKSFSRLWFLYDNDQGESFNI